MKALLLLMLLVMGERALAQQSQTVQPFSCPSNTFNYGYSPSSGGWLCSAPYGSSAVSGTFSCPSMTVTNGIVTSIQNGTCGIQQSLGLYSGGGIGLYLGGSIGLY